MIPGPGIMLTITTALGHEWKRVLVNVFGMMSGLAVVASVALAGLGLVVGEDSLILRSVQVAGVAYLMYLGFKKVNSSRVMRINGRPPQGSARESFYQGFFLSVFGAKPLIFFSSVIPQFVDPKGDYASQFLVLLLIFVSLVFLIHMAYASFARVVKGKLESNPSFFAEAERVSGWFFIGISLLLAWNLFS